MPPNLTINVQYCGGWGYARYYKRLKAFLEFQSFASSITVQGAKDKRITGNFEVTILESNELIHSAKSGMGHRMSDSEMNAVVLRLEDALDA